VIKLSGMKTWQKVVAVLAAIGVIGGLAAASLALGATMTVLAFGLTAAIATQKLALDRRYAIAAGAVGVISLAGTCNGIGTRSQIEATQQRQRVDLAARARAEADRSASVRSAAPALMARVGDDVDRARALIASGDFDGAHRIAETARDALAETVALAPAVDGAESMSAVADSLFRDSANLSAIQAAILDARDAKATSPERGRELSWSLHLETLSAALRQAPPVARERFGAELESLAVELDARRGRFRREIERAQRAESARLARVALCGANPPASIDLRVAVELFAKRSANDPDSVEVVDCTPAVDSSDRCWVATCSIRGRNAFGALVLSRYEVSAGRTSILGMRPAR